MFYWFLFICLFFLLTFNSTLSHRPKYRNEIFYVQPTNHPTTIFKRKIYINRYAPTTTTQNQPFEHTHPTWSICYCYLTIQSKWIYNTKIRKKKNEMWHTKLLFNSKCTIPINEDKLCWNTEFGQYIYCHHKSGQKLKLSWKKKNK